MTGALERLAPYRWRMLRGGANGLLLATMLLLASAPLANAQTPELPNQFTQTTRGYITMPDGVELAYGVTIPDTPGRHPVALDYAGYSNTEDPPTDNDGRKLIADGFATLAVNVRGSGCSGGTFNIFERKWATDGYRVVEWAARQPWSDGHVVMWGTSFPGITQWMVAALHPPHLDAIAPASTIGDIYRDVGFPGGVPNTNFSHFWYADQNAEQTLNVPT